MRLVYAAVWWPCPVASVYGSVVGWALVGPWSGVFVTGGQTSRAVDQCAKSECPDDVRRHRHRESATSDYPCCTILIAAQGGGGPHLRPPLIPAGVRPAAIDSSSSLDHCIRPRPRNQIAAASRRPNPMIPLCREWSLWMALSPPSA